MVVYLTRVHKILWCDKSKTQNIFNYDYEYAYENHILVIIWLAVIFYNIMQLNKLQTSHAIKKIELESRIYLVHIGPSLTMLSTTFTLLVLITRLPLILLTKKELAISRALIHAHKTSLTYLNTHWSTLLLNPTSICILHKLWYPTNFYNKVAPILNSQKKALTISQTLTHVYKTSPTYL